MLKIREVGFRCERRVVLCQRAAPGDPSSVSSASGAQKKSKAVVRKESADAQEYEPHKQEGMDMECGRVGLSAQCRWQLFW